MRYILLAVLLLAATIVPLRAQTDTEFVAITGTFAAATAFDVATTIRAKNRCPNCWEGNPLARPFVNAGTVPLILLGGAHVAGTVVLTNYLRRTKVGRHVWWILPAALTAVHTYAGIHNLGVGQDASLSIEIRF